MNEKKKQSKKKEKERDFPERWDRGMSRWAWNGLPIGLEAVPQTRRTTSKPDRANPVKTREKPRGSQPNPAETRNKPAKTY